MSDVKLRAEPSFGSQNAGFQSFSQAYRIGNQDAAAGLAQGLQGWRQLVGFEIHHGAMAQVDAGIVRQDEAALALDGEQGGVEHWTGIGDQLRLSGIQDRNGTFERGQELTRSGRAPDPTRRRR
jgi:hypothetical protein